MEAEGYFAEPTTFDKVSTDMMIAAEKIFGPVPGVMIFDAGASFGSPPLEGHSSRYMASKAASRVCWLMPGSGASKFMAGVTSVKRTA